MTKVTRYEATDGSLHKTPKERDAKNVELRTLPLMEEFANGLKPEDVGNVEGHLAIALEDLPAFLVKHADTLRKALNRALVTPKPRKAKGEAGDKPKRSRPAKEDKPAAPAATGGGDALDGLLGELS